MRRRAVQHVLPSLVVLSLVTDIVVVALMRASTPVCLGARADGQWPAGFWKLRVIGSSIVFRACLKVLNDRNVTDSDQKASHSVAQ